MFLRLRLKYKVLFILSSNDNVISLQNDSYGFEGNDQLLFFRYAKYNKVNKLNIVETIRCHVSHLKHKDIQDAHSRTRFTKNLDQRISPWKQIINDLSGTSVGFRPVKIAWAQNSLLSTIHFSRPATGGYPAKLQREKGSKS